MIITRTYFISAKLSNTSQLADGKTSLRQLARYLNRDILTVAKVMYPYVQQGWVQLVYSNTFKTGEHQTSTEFKYHKGRIICVEDTLAIYEKIEPIFKLQGYEVISITNPLEVLSLVLQLEPDLILWDVSIPEPDGYEICSMLRHCTAFRFVPIILLTGTNRFVDHVRARMAGATDYVTKPLTDQELLMLVEQYLSPDLQVYQ
ncbi:MAG: response regulator [Cuspidothrix sp.]